MKPKLMECLPAGRQVNEHKFMAELIPALCEAKRSSGETTGANIK